MNSVIDKIWDNDLGPRGLITIVIGMLSDMQFMNICPTHA